ncbi:hypothetical protein BDBG_00674 [Blastomyces gilchristii SLH14081]|uniref:HAUS augmin-like complex subunit 6 N-terminal domain-containing protein n=1 Tax=Blastomyces gilchristii (strain SLH14081) TaxID=559298 RepID=A0A179U8J2_BLAGS|nr:uncharacterized protein BDBG_00674 [Blastomyces gilchristii SLH14081]OAT04043.1 hypothetical protein BDBG_00674 [Blastomyces gilchristii SLH14081]
MQSSTRPSPKPKGLNWPVSSNITIFVRNLRLLRLDQLPDWPNITVRSFAGAQPNLRQRIKAVEWSLYQLFTIWDPEGTQNRLRPFFPPLEPLQSVNLRAALFRALSDLKKNGVLGREAILRKTMLDECKGEKFEEALATFSLAVLREVILARKGEHKNPVLEMTINGCTSSPEQEMLVPLVIAHRAALTTMINDKCHVREAYDHLKILLENKTKELAVRSKEAANKPTANEAELTHEIMNLWYGNEKWADIILNGGMQVFTDRVLESSFSRALSLIKNGRLDDMENRSSSDLLADLDNRLAEQKARVEKWRKFKQTLVEERRASPPSKHRSSSKILAFRNHQPLTIASLAQSDRKSTPPSLNDTKYSSLVSDLDAALLKHNVNISQKKERPDSGDPRNRRLSNIHSNRNYSLDQAALSLLADQPTPNSNYMDNASIISSLPTQGSSRGSPRLESGEVSGSGTPHYEYFSGVATPSITIEYDSNPSPVNEDAESPQLISVNSTCSVSSNLIERTRHSMSFLPTPSARPRQSLAAKPRKSQVFPTNQFETPKKRDSRSLMPGSSGTLTPKEELFSQDADYASVFKSRPRVAMSPVNSPAVHILPLDDRDMDGDGDRTIDMDAEMSEGDLQNSPLFGARFTSRA